MPGTGTFGGDGSRATATGAEGSRTPLPGEAIRRTLGTPAARRWAVFAGGIVALLGLWVLARHDPAQHALFPPCLFHRLTGLHCTGCGSARALHALLDGDLRLAWAQNPLLVVLLPGIAYGLLRKIVPPGLAFLPAVTIPSRWLWAFVAVTILFSVARNLPFVGFLGPGD